MDKQSGFAFVYVSTVMGGRVVDLEGRALGRVADVVATTTEMYPLVRGLVISSRRPGARRRVAPVTGPMLRALAGGAPLRLDPAVLKDLELGHADFLVRVWLLDQQIVDVQGAKVERVNDVHLLVTDRAWIVHVEVGFAGVLRRLGFDRAARALWSLTRKPYPEDLVSWKFVQPLAEHEEVGRPIRLKIEHAQIRNLHPGEIADILEELGKDERTMILRSLGPEAAADALEETEEETQTAVIAELEPEMAADILEEMDPGEAADILTSLPDAHSETIIAAVEPSERAQLEQLIEYEEKTAAGLMTPEFVAVHPDATVAETIEELRRQASEIESIYYTYVLDAERTLLGVTTLRRLLRVGPEERIGDIMETRLVTVRPEDSPRTVAEVFQKYSFLACPVVDAGMHMMGVILIKHAFDDLLPEFQREARA
jgi:CBS domain-containing protein/sporulation protein YlmC with PRC-barrel domain